jgi:hypothetical protein
MNQPVIQAELPPELTGRAQMDGKEGWATDVDEQVTVALRRFLESHCSRVTEGFVMEDVPCGRHGNE